MTLRAGKDWKASMALESPQSKETGMSRSLSTYHGKRVAVVLSLQDTEQVVCGTANWTRDPTLGNVLQIVLDDEPESASPTTILIAENEWQGEILPDGQYGCDVCLRLS